MQIGCGPWGFDSKTLIHLGQIAAANSAFQPSQEAATHARAIMTAFRRPQNTGKGIISLDGKTVERLHLSKAEKLLQKLEKTRDAP